MCANRRYNQAKDKWGSIPTGLVWWANQKDIDGKKCNSGVDYKRTRENIRISDAESPGRDTSYKRPPHLETNAQNPVKRYV